MPNNSKTLPKIFLGFLGLFASFTIGFILFKFVDRYYMRNEEIQTMKKKILLLIEIFYIIFILKIIKI